MKNFFTTTLALLALCAATLAHADEMDIHMTTDADIEADIQAKGLTAPRLTPEAIDAVIVRAEYLQPEGTTLTICVLHLQNGFCVTGESAAASLANFDAQIGQRIAYSAAREKIWPLEGYLPKQRLWEGERTSA